MDLAVIGLNGHGNKQSVVQTLMIAFGVIVSHVLRYGTA